MTGRAISQRTWRLIQELREASGKQHQAKSADELRAEAQARLDAMNYTDKPLEASASLKAQLSQPRGL